MAAANDKLIADVPEIKEHQLKNLQKMNKEQKDQNLHVNRHGSNEMLAAVCKAVPYQLCPKCNGQGLVSKPNYLCPGDVFQWTSTSAAYVCDVCQGQKIIPMFIINEQIKVLPDESNFKQLRKSKGLTLRQVEKLTGISNAYLSQLENGKIKKPSHDTVQKLNAVYYGG